MGTTYDTLISLQLGKRIIFHRNFGISVPIKSNFVSLYYLKLKTSVPCSALFTKLTFAC